MSNVKQVSAKQVRDFFKENPAKVPAGLEANVNGRGRLHPELVKAFNKAKRSKAQYEVGRRDNKLVVITGPRGKKFEVHTSALREFAGQPEGTRGRFSKGTLERYLNEVLLSA